VILLGVTLVSLLLAWAHADLISIYFVISYNFERNCTRSFGVVLVGHYVRQWSSGP
jgi:hypothetical protein